MIYGLGLAAMFIAWLIPGHYFPWTGFQQEVAAASGAGLIGLAALASTQSLQRLPAPHFAVAALALSAVPMLQWAAGQVPYLADAALSSLYIAGFALTMVASVALAEYNSERFVASLFIAILTGAVVSALIGLAQWLKVDLAIPTEMLGPGERIYGNFTQPNHLATVLWLGIVAAIWLFETRRVSWASVCAVFGLLTFVLVTTQSRTGWLACFVLGLWWLFSRRRSGLRTTPWSVLGAGATYAGMTIAYPYLNGSLGLAAPAMLTERATTMGTRAIHWVTLWDAVWARPLLGWGWMQVGDAQQSVALTHAASHEWISYSHNLVLDLLIWNGVILGGGICLALLVWAWRRGSDCKDSTTWCLIAAMAILATHAMLEFPHAYAYFLLPAAVIIGVVESRSGAARGRLSLSRWAFTPALVCAAALVAWIAQEYLQVEDASGRQRFKEAGYVSSQQPAVPRVLLLDNQREFLWLRMTDATRHMAADDLERMREVSKRFMPPAVLLRYALASGLNGRPDEARRSLMLICHLWPRRNCDEGRSSWKSLQDAYEELRAVEYPPATAVPQANSRRLTTEPSPG